MSSGVQRHDFVAEQLAITTRLRDALEAWAEWDMRDGGELLQRARHLTREAGVALDFYESKQSSDGD